jgi:hypothetical protein
MGQEPTFILVEENILENGKMIRGMDKEHIIIVMGINMLENGKMISTMGKEKKFGVMVVNMKVNGIMGYQKIIRIKVNHINQPLLGWYAEFKKSVKTVQELV